MILSRGSGGGTTLRRGVERSVRHRCMLINIKLWGFFSDGLLFVPRTSVPRVVETSDAFTSQFMLETTLHCNTLTK